MMLTTEDPRMNDLEQIYFWLRRDDFPPKYPHAVQIQVSDIHAARHKSTFSIHPKQLDMLKQLIDSCGSGLERAQVRLECAWAAGRAGLRERAQLEIEEALWLLEPYVGAHPEYRHYHAVALWMLGAVLRQDPATCWQAVPAWEHSLEQFEILSYPLLLHEAGWYQERCVEMRKNLTRAAQEEMLSSRISPADKQGLQKQLAIPESQPSSSPLPQPTDDQYAVLFAGSVRYLDVLGEIPAGGFGPSGIDPYQLERIMLKPRMSEVSIKGIRHRLKNLHSSSRMINLFSSRSYFLLKVYGDSMNEAGIDPGDYVLLRSQEDAENTNIVAAEVRGIDTRATLKQFIEDDQTITLKPQSRNSSHRSYEFTKGKGTEGRLYIRGVALGVFKPVP